VKNCTHSEENRRNLCNCTYTPCPRKGICCECIAYHRRSDELPACFFPPEAERTYNRSIGNFIRLHYE
jgi:hypothetical protein